DTLQTTSDTSEVSSILAALTSSSGWYIKLDQNSGEKVVAKSLVFSKAAHYTTHTPNAAPSADPCQPGNLGTGRIYVVDYLTGESVVNYDTGNDSSAPDNARATATEGQVLQRSDRVKTLGSGMPSGVVAIISASGESAIMVGIGGGLAMPETKSDTGVVRIYWREK
ncbi:MAG: hypothetical protein OEV28_09065, partial [Nitrospirota bacterium]|nr:hypothetical protein [Nitrospirota bacterium]